MDFIFLWGPKIIFTILFVLVGYLSFRHKTIPIRVSYWVLFLYPIERFLEIAARTVFTINSSYNLPADSFSVLWTRAQLLTSLQRIFIGEGTIILIAAIVWFLLSLYAHRTNESKIDQSDVNILTFGILVSGWPNFFIFLMLVFVCAVIGMIFFRLFAHSRRIPVTPFFVIAGTVMIYWGWTLSTLTGLYALR